MSKEYTYSTHFTYTSQQTQLSINEIEQMIEMLYPILYYKIDKYMESGKFYLIKETSSFPQFVMCHPDDFDILKDVVGKVRKLVDLKEYNNRFGFVGF